MANAVRDDELLAMDSGVFPGDLVMYTRRQSTWTYLMFRYHFRGQDAMPWKSETITLADYHSRIPVTAG